MMKLTALALAACITGCLADDSITSLPGYNYSTVGMYSGYINVDEANGRNLFYFFAEAQTNPSTAPVLLWRNGGPGCSSLGGGLMSELGPFFPTSDGTGLTPNPYSWNQYANMIFLESPAGVGFSYSLNTSDYTTGDEQTAIDVYNFIQGFMKRYPQYASNPFYMSGESYAGHYIPTSAAYLVSQNIAGQNPKINFQGFAVGNAWTVAGIDNTGAVEYWYEHALVSNASYNGILATCNMSDVGPLFAGSRRGESARRGKSPINFDGPKPSGALGFMPILDAVTGEPVTYAHKSLGNKAMSCDDWQNQAFAEQGNIDIYDIYTDVDNCDSPPPTSANIMARDGHASPLRSGSNGNSGCSLIYNPCVDSAVQTYLNLPAVKAAIHANASINWVDCSSVVNYSRFDLLSSVIPSYQYLLENAPNAKYVVYSGDVDAIVPVTGTRNWLELLDLPIVNPWRAYTVDGQVGGYTYDYQGLSVVTVRNAGHMVPYTQQSRAAYMISHFLSGTPL